MIGWFALRFRRFLLVISAGVAAALLFSFLNPVSPLADSVTHFRLHLLGLLAALGIVLAALRVWRPALGAGVLVTLIALVGLRPAWPFSAAPSAEAPNLSILQLNLLYRNSDLGAVRALIAAEKPDLITLQEVSDANMPLLAALRQDYPHQAICPFARVGAVAVLSRFPPVNRPLSQSQGCFVGRGIGWLRVATPHGPLTVSSLHLHWPYPFSQAAQLDDIAPALKTLPGPHLIGGDFNAAPWSHAVDRVAQAADAPVLGGLRFTIHKRFFPLTPEIGIPIDHILADPALQLVAISVSGPVGSDHRAVLARLRWREGR